MWGTPIQSGSAGVWRVLQDCGREQTLWRSSKPGRQLGPFERKHATIVVAHNARHQVHEQESHRMVK